MIEMLKSVDSDLSTITISDYRFKTAVDGMELLKQQTTEIYEIKIQVSEIQKWIETILET